ncbi:hypothetical protein RY27_05850, partial [Litorilinea aerophila]
AAILLVYIVILVAFGGLLAVALPRLLSFSLQLLEREFLTQQLTTAVTELRFTLYRCGQLHTILPFIRISPELLDSLASTQAQVEEQAWPMTWQMFKVLGQIGLILVLAFYWLVARDETLRLLLTLSPFPARETVHTVWNSIEDRLGAYLRGQLFLMGIIGGATFLMLLALGVPNPLALAVIAGLFEAVPMVGPILGAVPAVLAALQISPATALAVVVGFVILQALESNLLVPRVMSSNVGLNPLWVMVALIGGSMLNGLVGALLAVPVAGAAQVILQHMWLTNTSPLSIQSRRKTEEARTPEPTLDCDEENTPEPTLLVARE